LAAAAYDGSVIVCVPHVYSGELPCPWPSCRPADTLNIAGHEFAALRFIGAGSEDLYAWDLSTRTAAFSLAKLTRRAVAEFNGVPFDGGDGLLYHYAKLTTLDAILASREIWISDYRALNDTSEVSFGRGVAERSFARYSESSTWGELLSNCLAASLNEAFFVASFSLVSDCLNQWSRYGEGGKGVAIGFGISEFESLIAVDPMAILLSQVTYDATTQDLLFRTVTSLARQVFDLDEKRGTHEPFILVRELQRIISELLPLCKNPSFADEREGRLVVVPCLTLSGVTGGLESRHRSTTEGDVVYITTRDIAPDFQLPLRAVVSGPLISSDDSERVRTIASANGLQFRQSTIPLRRSP
jgi:hypothetical protein